MNINILPDELKLELSKYLNDEDLSNLNCVNKSFNGIINGNEQALYSETVYKIKGLINKILSDEESYAKHVSSSLFSRFVSLIDNHNVVKSIFPSIHEEVARQNKMQADINTSKLNLKRTKCAYRICADLFGNIRRFERLPVLEIEDNVGSTGYLDFIKPKHMTDSLMKGVDTLGRRFFTIKVNDPDSKRQTCQTFFERYSNSDDLTWVSAGNNREAIPFYSSWVDDSGAVCKRQQENYELLKALIHEGKITRGNVTYALA